MQSKPQTSWSDRLLLAFLSVALLLNSIGDYVVVNRVLNLEARPTVVISPEAIIGGFDHNSPAPGVPDVHDPGFPSPASTHPGGPLVGDDAGPRPY